MSDTTPEQLADDQYRYYLCLAVMVLLFLLAANLTRSRAGRARTSCPR